MASVVDICNIALQKLGASRIVSLTQDTENARECNLLYEQARDAELRAHPWNFAIKRAQLASSTAPVHGPTSAYPLPSDCLRLLPQDPCRAFDDLDWQIEGRSIVTDDTGALDIRYIYRVTDPNLFDALFVELMACRLAEGLNEKITQSNSKGQQIREDRRVALREARKVNAFENQSQEAPEGSWLTVRR
jgi:hypothetical protein